MRRISKSFAWPLKGKGQETLALTEKKILGDFVAFWKKEFSPDLRIAENMISRDLHR
jgi:hypothetical protein